MSGTLSSLNTALSALRYNQTAMDTASQNIANVNTEGYTRRRVEGVTAGTPTTPAMWSRDQSAGGGVRIAGITRMADAFLDTRVRTEQGKQSYLDTKQAALERLESGIGEPGDNGVASVLAEFRTSWSDLANSPDSDAARSQVMARGAALADAIQLQARNFTTEAGDQRARLNALVTEVNTVAFNLSETNKAIAVGQLDGADTNNLLDQRDMFALRLAELTGGKATANASGGFDFAVNGVNLVTGGIPGQLVVATGVTPSGAADGLPISFEITHPVSGTSAVPSGVSGEVGGTTEVIDVTIPQYLVGLGNVAKTLADGINAVHTAGYDETGAAGQPFFSYNAADPAGTIGVALTDNSQVAAATIPGGVVDGSNAVLLGEVNDTDGVYQQLVNSFGTTVAAGKRLSASQQMMTDQVKGAQDQMAGVNLDEEMLSMVNYQRAYEAAARVMTTVDSILDTLINRTGLLR